MIDPKKVMTTVSKIKTGIIIAGIFALSVSVSGCVSGPTYGTDKSTSAQMAADISNIFSLRSQKNSGVEVKPRPELVRPNAAIQNQLPAPQSNIANTNSPDWPESPEQRRARLRAEATANQDNSNYVSPITSSASSSERYLPSGIDRASERADRMPDQKLSQKQRAEYLRLKQETKSGTTKERKYLSEPPITYRQPAVTAPIDDLGPDEAQKARQRKSNSAKKSRLWPF